MARPAGLPDDEELVALLPVRFSIALPHHVDAAPSPTIVGSVVQRRAFSAWCDRATAVDFPVAGPEMILGVTAHQVLVWRPALIRSRPKRFAGAIPIERIRRAGVRRRVFSSVLAMMFEEGELLGVETMRGRRLDAFAAAIPTYTGRVTGRTRNG